jgi:hypothetical protein
MNDIIARTVQDFCAAYGIGETMCRRLIAEGKLEARKVSSRRILILETSARAWLGLPMFQPASAMRNHAIDGDIPRKRRYQRSSKYREKPHTAGR